MKYQQFTNENQGLSYYDEKKEVTSGYGTATMSGLLDMFTKDLDFNAIASAIGIYIGQNVSLAKKGLLIGSYVPDMLRLYMKTVRVNRVAFQWKDYNTSWLPLYIRSGFDSEITGYFFKKFEEMHTKGLVPRSIWYPSPTSKGDNGGSNGVHPDNGGMGTGAMFGIGIGAVALLGVGYFLMRK